MDVSNFIDTVAAGNAVQAKEILNDLLSARAFDSLDAKKIEMAQTVFNGKQEESAEPEVQETEETTTEQ